MIIHDNEIKAPIFGISRHRIGTDGKGVTTLVTFMMCPLRCKYCLNERCHDDVEGNDKVMMLSPRELYDIVKVDNIYFQATGGGICFGGGESTLYVMFIEKFRKLCGDRWKITLETCLRCTYKNIFKLSNVVDYWIVDVKSMDDEIYQKYTGKVSYIKQHLRSLSICVKPDKVMIKVPYITDFNRKEDLNEDVDLIKQQYGFENVRIVDYIKPKSRNL